MIDRDETRELDQERVRESLGDAGERDTGHSGERIDPSRDREARERLDEQPPAGDRDQGEGAEPSGDDDVVMIRARTMSFWPAGGRVR